MQATGLSGVIKAASSSSIMFAGQSMPGHIVKQFPHVMVARFLIRHTVFALVFEDIREHVATVLWVTFLASTVHSQGAAVSAVLGSIFLTLSITGMLQKILLQARTPGFGLSVVVNCIAVGTAASWSTSGTMECELTPLL